MRQSNWIPWAFGAVFGMFLLGAVALSVIAVRSDPGLVAGAPQRRAGSYMVSTVPSPVLELRVVSRGASGIVLEARVRGKDGRPAVPETVTGTLGRATHARQDRTVTFEPAAGGIWRAVVAPPGEGTWEVAARAEYEGQVAHATLRL